MFALRCLFCDHGNPVGAKFCNSCGSSLSLMPCAACAAVNDRAAACCRQCRQALAPAPVEASDSDLWPDLESELAALETELAVAAAKNRARRTVAKAAVTPVSEAGDTPADEPSEARGEWSAGTPLAAETSAAGTLLSERPEPEPGRTVRRRSSWIASAAAAIGTAAVAGYLLHRGPTGAAQAGNAMVPTRSPVTALVPAPTTAAVPMSATVPALTSTSAPTPATARMPITAPAPVATSALVPVSMRLPVLERKAPADEQAAAAEVAGAPAAPSAALAGTVLHLPGARACSESVAAVGLCQPQPAAGTK